MAEIKYQHEVVVPDEGIPFRLAPFEGGQGKYVRDKHWHRSVELFAVEKGELDFFIYDELYHIDAGGIIIVNSNEVHSIHARVPNDTVFMQIPLNLFEKYYTNEHLLWFFHNLKEYDSKVYQLVTKMYHTYVAREMGYELKVISLFYELLYLMVTNYRQDQIEQDIRKANKQLAKLGTITEYIREHYTEEISLEKLASLFGYSPYYLSRMFQKYAGINYKDYLYGVRMKQALKELTNTDHPIGEIALNHGFASSKAFSNSFRKKYGILPNQYRKDQKRAIGEKRK